MPEFEFTTALALQAGPSPKIMIENEDDVKQRIAQAQSAFDQACMAISQYYIQNLVRIMFVTATTFFSRVFKGFKPKIIVIDEVTQMTEVDSVAVIAIFFHSIQKIILAGDLNQNCSFVGSISVNEFSRIAERSLMERMFQIGVSFTFLTTQYRMHFHISRLVSKLFYNDRLRNGDNVINRQSQDEIFEKFLRFFFPETKHHFVFLHIPDAKVFRAKRGGSKANPYYVVAVQVVVNELVKYGARSIGILSFYKAQMHLHQKLASPLVSVMIVDFSEGREYDFVVLDNVTPGGTKHNLEFVADPHKINVALSRARNGLVIICHHEMGKVKHSYKGSKIWVEIVAHHLAMGSVGELRVADGLISAEMPSDQYEEC